MERYYFSTREGETKGPVSLGELRHMQIGGVLPAHTRICREGTTIWRPIAPLQTLTPQEFRGPNQILALIGSAFLFVGVFCPIVSLPIIGQMNYFQNGKGDGTIILVLAVASAVLALAKLFRLLWLTGGASLAILSSRSFDFSPGLATPSERCILIYATTRLQDSPIWRFSLFRFSGEWPY